MIHQLIKETFHFYSVISSSSCGLSGLKFVQIVRLLLYKQTSKISGSEIPKPTQVRTQGGPHVHFVISIRQSILDQGFRGLIQSSGCIFTFGVY
jgi:hypothetical protein